MDNPIPQFAQSSIDPTKVSLTIQSIGKAGAAFIALASVIGFVDPQLTSAAAPLWAGWVASVASAVPAGFAVFYATEALWGIIRKIGVAVFAKKLTA